MPTNAFRQYCQAATLLESLTELEAFIISLTNEKDLTDNQKEKIKEIIEQKLEQFSLVNGNNDRKFNQLMTENDINEGDIDFPEYNHDEFIISSKSWQVLNPDNYPYEKWLLKIGLPEFWIQPNKKIQNTILAICCFINSEVVPSWTNKARKESQLPLIVFSGESRSGKTEGSKFIFSSYHPSRTKLIKADSTGTSLRDEVHRTCYSEIKNKLLPSVVLVDNYERKFLDKWGSFKTLLLSVLRSQSHSTISLGKGETQKFYSHCLKLFTTVENVKAFTSKQSEFYNRMIFLFTERQPKVKSIANYDFSDIPNYYKKVWNKDDVKNRWYSILADFLRQDDDCSKVPAFRWAQSLLIMATGVYLNIWECREEASEFMSEYWEWVQEKEKTQNEDIELLIEEFIGKMKIKQLDNIINSIGSGRNLKTTIFNYNVSFTAKELIDFICKKSIKSKGELVWQSEEFLGMCQFKKELDKDSNITWKKEFIFDYNEWQELL